MNVVTPHELDRARESFGRRAWAEAYEALSLVDRSAPLEIDDLELLALSAYLTGNDEEYLRALERAHHGLVEAGKLPRAVRCAFWIGLRLMFRREMGPATGWFARAGRLLEQETQDCAEAGYLMLPLVQKHLGGGHWDSAHDTASKAVAIGMRFGEPDLIACALHLQGIARIRQGKCQEGLTLVDEAMVAVTAGELSPLVTGLIYCSVVEACQKSFVLERAREWTVALARWCNEQPQMVAFTDRCLVHRAEVLQLQGAWDDAMDEARLACDRGARRPDMATVATAYYCQAELHRLRGDHDAAERAYRLAGQWGREPQPGLALLRLAQGRVDAAAASIRRVLTAAGEPLERARQLPAYVETLLALGEQEAALEACTELRCIADTFATATLGAMADYACGATSLARGDAAAALGGFRSALSAWQEIGAPYESALAQVGMALACRALGDDEAAEMELDAARQAFERLGAAPDMAQVDSISRRAGRAGTNGLTSREVQVLRMVAEGETNRAIAGELSLSVKTVDRHLGNIFNKLGVASRAAATAHAFKRKLI